MSIEEVLAAKYLVICVNGPYAGEKVETMLNRKTDESSHGYTFWHHQSYAAPPHQIQEFCKEAALRGHQAYFALISSSSTSGEGKDTKHTDRAKEFRFSQDGEYLSIPNWIYVEKGNRRPYAIKLSKFSRINSRVEINLGNYSLTKTKTSVRIRQGASTMPIINEPPLDSSKNMKHCVRGLLASGVITEPFSVWLR